MTYRYVGGQNPMVLMQLVIPAGSAYIQKIDLIRFLPLLRMVELVQPFGSGMRIEF